MQLLSNRDVSLVTKLIITIAFVEMVLFSLLVWNDINLTKDQLLLQKQEEISEFSTLISSTLVSAIRHNDIEEILEIVKRVGKSHNANFIAVKSADHETIAQAGIARQSTPINRDLLSNIKNLGGKDSFHVVFPLRENNTPVGELHLEFSTNDINHLVSGVRKRDIIDALVIVTATVIILYILLSSLTKNLKTLSTAVTEYIDNHRIITPIPCFTGEVGELSATISKLFTALRNGEDSLRENENLLQAILDNSPTIIYAKDKDGKYLLANKQFADFFDSTEEHLLGKTDYELFPQEIAYKLRANDEKVIASKSIQQIEEIVPHGEELKTFISTKFCLFDINNDVYAICGITTDISDRIRNEKRIKESEENLRSLANNATDGILVNKKGKHVFANQHMAEILNTTVDEIIGSDLDYVVHPSEKDNVVQRFKRRLKGQNEPIQYETLFTDKKSSEPVPVELTAFISQWDGEPSGVVFVRDIKQRKQTESELKRYREQLEHMVSERTAELEGAIRELESFSYSVSHDLRSPLRSIDGFSQLLLEDYQDKLDEHGIDYLNRVRKAAQRMAQLIDDILLLSRVSRHKLLIAPVNLSDIAEEAAASLAELYPERKITIKIEPNMNTKGDQRLLRIVMDNLLDNAWKYTGQNTDAMVECGCRLDNAHCIYFVKDNGVGFNMQYSEKLFGAFQRLHGIDEFPGTGIGLATVKRIIDRHGGKIWAESKPGEGAVFYFSLQ
ncbi:MAG: PAS domain S-box protein [Gammaproteobacteria bacterium]|jgi:PAS domain S-box-containing protein